MKKIFLSLTIIASLNACGQQKQHTSEQKMPPVKETIEKPSYLVGIKTKADLKEQPFVLWFDSGFANYTPDAAIVNEIKKHLDGVTIKAFMGTWCGDSRHEIPHFYKILDLAGFDEKNLQLITVDRSKKTPDHLEEGLDIHHVPTLIFYKNGNELGRFVEYPQDTLEKDILAIVSGQPYKHSYQTN